MTEREDKTPVAPSGAAEEQEILLDSPIVESEDEPGAVDAPGVSGSKEPDEAAVESTPVVEEDAVEPVPRVVEALAGTPEAAASADADAAAGLPAIPEGDSKFIYTGVAEGFFVDMKVAFVAGVFVACPFLFYQIWAFIAPGLYEEEKKYIIPLALSSALFFILGGVFCYFGVFPFAFEFFMSYSTDNIVAMLSIDEYLSFALKMVLAFGLIFEMPLFSFFLARMGLITAQKMREVRKYAILAIFVVAAILTPPDVFSQLMMAGPMIVLYEVSIWVAVLVGKKKAEREKAAEEGGA